MTHKITNKVLVALIAFNVVGGIVMFASRGSWQEGTAASQLGLAGQTIVTTPASQVGITFLKEGAGVVTAENGDTMTIHYTGTLSDGTVFDSSRPKNTPLSFTLGSGRVIKGMEEGVFGMKAGEQRRISIPPELGYGAAGIPGVIPPNATLIFDVELVKLTKSNAPPAQQ